MNDDITHILVSHFLKNTVGFNFAENLAVDCNFIKNQAVDYNFQENPFPRPTSGTPRTSYDLLGPPRTS